MNQIEITRIDFSLRIDFLIDPERNFTTSTSPKNEQLLTLENVYAAMKLLQKEDKYFIINPVRRCGMTFVHKMGENLLKSMIGSGFA